MGACMAAMLVGVRRVLDCPFDGAWCLVCALCLLAVPCVNCRCSLCFVFLDGARCLELSPCNTQNILLISTHISSWRWPVPFVFVRVTMHAYV